MNDISKPTKGSQKPVSDNATDRKEHLPIVLSVVSMIVSVLAALGTYAYKVGNINGTYTAQIQDLSTRITDLGTDKQFQDFKGRVDAYVLDSGKNINGGAFGFISPLSKIVGTHDQAGIDCLAKPDGNHCDFTLDSDLFPDNRSLIGVWYLATGNVQNLAKIEHIEVCLVNRNSIRLITKSLVQNNAEVPAQVSISIQGLYGPTQKSAPTISTCPRS